MTVALVMTSFVLAATARRSARVPAATATGLPLLVVVASMVGPAAAASSAVAAGAALWRRRLSAARRRKAAADADVTILGELVLLGVGAGMTFLGALELAATEVAPELRAEVAGVVRRARRSGAAAVLEAATGRAHRLYLLAGRAALTGASISGAVAGFVAERHAEDQARRKAAGARLPVRLLVPLSLLILPGFVLLTVGPALLGAARRLGLLGP